MVSHSAGVGGAIVTIACSRSKWAWPSQLVVEPFILRRMIGIMKVIS